MTVLTENPPTVNYLSPLYFTFQVKKLPSIKFFVQNVNLPGMSLNSVDIVNPNVRIPYAGDHISYDDIMINYKVDENLTNYLEIHNWIRKLGFPESSNEFKEINEETSWTGGGKFSDISLIISNSDRIPKFEINFEDAHPVSISSLIFDTTHTEANYLEAAVTFKYTKFDINAI